MPDCKQLLVSVGRAHPIQLLPTLIFPDWRIGQWRVQAVQVPFQIAVVASDDFTTAQSCLAATKAEDDIAFCVFNFQVVVVEFIVSRDELVVSIYDLASTAGSPKRSLLT